MRMGPRAALQDRQNLMSACGQWRHVVVGGHLLWLFH